VRFLLLCAVSFPLLADARRDAHPAIFALTDLARSAPPEFAARGLLHLLDVNAIPTPAWQLDLANEALTLAAAARHPLPKRLAPGIAAVDNRAMLWNVAYAEGLDGLTLSLRAVDHIRRHDPAAARQAFAKIPQPAPAQATCKDPLLDDSSAWYRAAATLAADPLPIIQSIRTHAELAPAVDLIFQAQRSPEQLDTLAGALGQALRNLPPSDRAFNAALFDTPAKLKHLYNVLIAAQRPVAPLADGWRAWMTTGLEAPACTETRDPGPQLQARADAVELFNATLDTPLPSELLKPTGQAEAADLGPFADNQDTRDQAALFKQLLFGSGSRALSPAEKDTPAWREQFQKYIQSIDSRTRSSSESDIEFFYRQSQLWSGVLMAAPAGPSRDRALAQYIAFLLANAPHIDPLLWFSQLEAMAEISRSHHGAGYSGVLKALHLTGHPVLQLYAELEAAYPAVPRIKVQ